MKYHWIIDAGHGGMRSGVYQTFPNKMFKFEDGLTIYEGLINRAIARKLWLQFVENSVAFSLIYDEELDYSLGKRVRLADKIYAKYPNAICISIHSNASVSHDGKGLEIYTSKGYTKADPVAEIFCDVYKRDLCDFNFRSDRDDGDADKEADFYILRNTDCPAILVENLFFDNRKEAEYLLSEYGQQRIANALMNAVYEVEQKQPI